MDPSDVFQNTPELDYDRWREDVSKDWGSYGTSATDRALFAARTRHRKVFGFIAMDFTCNVPLVERTRQEARLDGHEHYYAAIQMAGGSTMLQNDQAVTIRAGDIALVDSAKPVTFIGEERSQYGQWFCLQFSRKSLISHIGFEPQLGSCGRRETHAARLFYQLALDLPDNGSSMAARGELYMRLMVYDLVGALFVPSDAVPVSLHTDKLFARICSIIRERFSDPDIAANKVAAEAGISLRYLQKLFTARGLTYSRYLYSVRLDHAALLLKRRALMNTGQPLAMIAWACGFRDYTHFARGYRRRFGHVPGSTGTPGQEADAGRTHPV